ncbi:MAG TPA: malto-oligosyltrehalose trehalohydrolase [Elusimicrobiota bacterium]|nr:malto-oligosyltrehalose trehalohydrolase [Elusimicrobiota bacterium]
MNGPGTSLWHPRLGAIYSAEGTTFRVWAPGHETVELILESPGRMPLTRPLHKGADGYLEATYRDIHPGDLYRYTVDGNGPFPDPASRFQPDGVHERSQVIDPNRFLWSDGTWSGVPREKLSIYEVHTGLYSPEGTFDGLRKRLPFIKELGVTAIELMPVADFPGRRNWGYDGVSLFAPARCYGTPDDLRRLVDESHRIGLAVLLDVVYNHFGPDGNYTGCYSPYYVSKKHRNPWGDALNFDGPGSTQVRRFFIENALHWIHEYHVDGFRLDATHAIEDDSPRHFLEELTETIHRAIPGRPLHVMAEDNRNLVHMISPSSAGGWGMDAEWTDDFHHQILRRISSRRAPYLLDYTGSTHDIAATLGQGWFYRGQTSPHMGKPHGTDPASISPDRIVIDLQNHDHVANYSFGVRIHRQTDGPTLRAMTVLLLCAPEIPLLFMGQEWGASTPFHYFTDHGKELGDRVTEGRRHEFRRYSDPPTTEPFHDPQDPDTFRICRLRDDEISREPHASLLRLHQALLRLRNREPAFRETGRTDVQITAPQDGFITLIRSSTESPPFFSLICLTPGGGTLTQPFSIESDRWKSVLSTEDTPYCQDPRPPHIDLSRNTVRFDRPGAIILA